MAPGPAHRKKKRRKVAKKAKAVRKKRRRRRKAKPAPVVNWTPADRAILAPPVKLSLLEWTEKYRILDARSSARPGPWRLAGTPYMGGPMEAFSSPAVEEITLKCSTQVGKTTFIENIAAYTFDQRPRPTLMLMPRKEDAFDFSRDRIMPLFECCPVLKARRPDADKDMTQRVYRMADMLFFLAWAGSPAAVASKPIGVALLDELSLYANTAKVKVDPVESMRERTRTFPDRKIVKTSTPLQEDDLIDIEFRRSDQRHYHLPCPHCGHWAPFRWEQLKYTEDKKERKRLVAERKRAKELAWYECESCGGRIDDVHKQKMLEAGVWARLREDEAESPAEIPAAFEGAVLEPFTRHMGFFLWAAYSPWLTFAEIAAQYLEAKGDREKHKVFWTLWLARSWQEEGKTVAPEIIRKCIDPERARGIVPEGTLALTAMFDLHDRHVPFVVRAWTAGSSYLVWHDVLVRHGKLSPLDDLIDPIRTRLWPDAAGGHHRIMLLGIDARWDTESVYRYCIKHPREVVAVMGSPSRSSVDIRGFPIERLPSGEVLKRGATAFHINKWLWNPILFDHMRTARGDPGEWRLYGEIEKDANYLQEVVNQAAYTRTRGGQAVTYWGKKEKKIGDHWFDVEAGAMALAWSPRVAVQRRTARRPEKKRAPDRPPVIERPPIRRSY